MNYASHTMNLLGVVSLADEREFWLGALMVRPPTREIVVGGRSEIVEPRVMQVLIVLAQAGGAVVSRDRLIERCWGGRIVGDDAINNCVGKVRALSALTTEPAFEVETVPRVGYRLIAAGHQTKTLLPIPAQMQVAASDGLADLDTGPSRLRPDSRKMIVPMALAGAVFALAIALLVSSRLVEPFHNHQMPGPPPQATVAVLPFAPLYSDRNAAVYADEISSDVADALGQTDLDVISPARSFQFRGDAKAGAARALHADILVDGDVRREGATLHVSIRVEDVASGLILLSKDVVGSASQAPDLPEQVAAFIAGALGWDASIKALKSSRRWNPRVRTGVLRALFQCSRQDDSFCAYEIGRQLVREAPDNAIAQSILAIATTNVLDELPERERPAVIATARKAAWAAIRLDPHFGDPYIALGALAVDEATREAYFRRGLLVDPDSPGLAGYLSALLDRNGRDEEALAVIQKIATRFRFSELVYVIQIRALLALGHPTDAVDIAKGALKFWPDSRIFVLSLLDAAAFQGNLADAEALLKDPMTGPVLQGPGDPPTFSDMVRALRTHRPQDIAAVSRDCAQFDSRSPDWRRTRPCVLVLTMLGRLDDAFQLAPDEERPTDLLFWPQTAQLRVDPRFRGLTEKFGIFAYWKATHTRPDFCATEHAPVCQALGPGHA